MGAIAERNKINDQIVTLRAVLIVLSKVDVPQGPPPVPPARDVALARTYIEDAVMRLETAATKVVPREG